MHKNVKIGLRILLGLVVLAVFSVGGHCAYGGRGGDLDFKESESEESEEPETEGDADVATGLLVDALPKEAKDCKTEDTFTLFWTTRAKEGLDFEAEEQLNDVFRAAEESEFYFLATEVNPGVPVFENRTTITALKGKKKVVNLKVVRVEEFKCGNKTHSITYEAKTQPEKTGNHLTIEDFRTLFAKLKVSRKNANLKHIPPVRPNEGNLQIQMEESSEEESEDLIQG